MIESARWSIDTNILVYATDPDAPLAKREIAQEMIKRMTLSPHAALVGQVLSEFMSVVLRKNAMSHKQALEAVDLLSQAADVLGASRQAYAQAWNLAAQHKYQVWDALIIAICADHGVRILYSEDAGSLKRPLGVRVINPFLDKVK